MGAGLDISLPAPPCPPPQALAALGVYRVEADAAVVGAWASLRAWRVFRHDSFEPGLVVVCFFAFVLSWMAVDFSGVLKHWRIQSSPDMSNWDCVTVRTARWVYTALGMEAAAQT